MKRLIILLFSSFLGIVGAPEVLMASDDYALSGLDNTGIVETVIIEETQDEPIAEEVQEEPVAIAPQEPVLPDNYITVGGRTIEIIDSNDTRNDAGRYAARYNDTFIYGHNSNVVFDVLYGVRIGNTFTIVYNGTATTYMIRNVIIYRKTGDTALRVDDASSGINGTDVPMKYIAKGQEMPGGAQYNIALMTCYGTSYGNGDASHRLVVFADAI